MVSVNERTFLSSDGKRTVAYRVWEPCETPKAVLQIVHGMGEHIERYDGFARFMAENGYSVWGHDQTGHGNTMLTPDDYQHLEPGTGWRGLSEDVQTLHKLSEATHPGLPSVLLGHSMGSFVARAYLTRYSGEFRAVILSGTGQNPALMTKLGVLLAQIEMNKLGDHGRSKLLNSMCFGKYNKAFKPARTDFDWLTRDEKIVDAYVSDPKCGGIATTGFFFELMRGLQFISDPSNLEKMSKVTPVLFISGARDPVGGNGKGVNRAAELFRKAGVRDVTVKLWEDGRHEMLNELNRNEVYAYIADWLGSKAVIKA
ncbi:MAG: alpha/beta hydrolase [Clostridiales bacterium]|nr:alpha/beta hydrolase [Clostridiales bacterium]